MLENTEGAIKNGKSRGTDNTWYTNEENQHVCWTPLCANKHKIKQVLLCKLPWGSDKVHIIFKQFPFCVYYRGEVTWSI